MARRFDWEEIRLFYDAGHTLGQCKGRFGVSNGAWNRAVARGDIVPRPRSHHGRPGATRDAVARLLADGLSGVAIARELGLSKATVTYHRRKLGYRVDERCNRRYDWVAVQAYHDEGHSKRACQAYFGFTSSSWYDAVQRGDLVPRPAAAPIEIYLVNGRKVNRGHLKIRLLRAGLKGGECERCGITEWLGGPLAIELHHVNGMKHDNRLENLQLLCPNCHSQTDTWGGRGAVLGRVVA